MQPNFYTLLLFLVNLTAKMSPAVPGPSKTKSLLTNRKLLDAFKGLKPNKIKIDDVSYLGDKYMQKATSIRFGYFLNWNDFSLFGRRFSSCFANLRLEQRQLKCSRNTETLQVFEQKLVSWPAKEELNQQVTSIPTGEDALETDQTGPGEMEDAVDKNDGEEGLSRHSVTACGRCTGRMIYKTSVNDQLYRSNLTLLLVQLSLS